MDFMLFDEPPRRVSKQTVKKPSEVGGHVKLEGLVVRLQPQSVLFFDDGTGKEVFLPYSKILDWWFTSSGTKRGLRIVDLELNDAVTLLVPKWLARREGLV